MKNKNKNKNKRFLIINSQEEEEDLIDEMLDSSNEEDLEFEKLKERRLLLEMGVDTEYTNKEGLSVQASVRFKYNNKENKFEILIVNEDFKDYVLKF